MEKMCGGDNVGERRKIKRRGRRRKWKEKKKVPERKN